jgi:hypothetical protein
VVQVGGDIVGKVLDQGLATDGWVVADDQDGEQFAAHTAAVPLTFATKRTRLSGAWHFRAKYYPAGIWAQSVTFRRNGTYELYYQVGDRGQRHSHSGRYAVTKPGRVVFKSHGKVVQGNGDGNLLMPVKGS